MDNDALVNYIDKILSFSQSRTYSKEEAEELTQEILLQAVKNIPTIQDMDKFEPWLWGVANNTLKSFRRSMGRARNMYSSEDTGAQVQYCVDEYEFEQDEIYDALRKNIAQLSLSYREIIIMRYYDGLTSKEIAERLNIPEGTVRYRLSVGREKLKKEINTMQETALKPVKLNLYTNGSYGGNPRLYLNDALSHNILYQAYREERTVGELSKLLGVPAYYIEDRIEMLLKCDTVTQPTKNTILTKISIFNESFNKYDDAQTKEFLKAMSGELFALADKLAAKIPGLGIYTAGRSHDELMCLFCVMAFDHSHHLNKKEESSTSECIPPSEKFDGGSWQFYAQTEDYRSIFFYDNRNWIETEKHTIGHIVYICPSFAFRGPMRTEQLRVCER